MLAAVMADSSDSFQLVSVAEACRILNVSDSTLRRLLRAGRLANLAKTLGLSLTFGESHHHRPTRRAVPPAARHERPRMGPFGVLTWALSPTQGVQRAPKRPDSPKMTRLWPFQAA